MLFEEIIAALFPNFSCEDLTFQAGVAQRRIGGILGRIVIGFSGMERRYLVHCPFVKSARDLAYGPCLFGWTRSVSIPCEDLGSKGSPAPPPFRVSLGNDVRCGATSLVHALVRPSISPPPPPPTPPCALSVCSMMC